MLRNHRNVAANVVAAVSALIAPPASAADAPAGLRIVETRETHVLDAKNLEGVVAQIRGQSDEGGVPVAGTSSALLVTYRLVPTKPGCRVEDLDVAVEVSVRLPQWEPAESVRPAIREQWERMRTGIELHEMGHRANAVEAAERLNERLRAYVPASDADCAAVDRAILRERIKAQMRFVNRDEAYDRRTKHGLTQAPKPPGEEEGEKDPHPVRDLRDRGDGRDLSESTRY